MAVPVTNGLVLHLEVDSGITATGSTVTAWSDASGSGNDLVARGNPQLLDDRTPSGTSALVFDGTGDVLERVDATDPLNGLPAGDDDRTMFFVVDYVDPEGVWSGLAYGDGAANETFGLTTSGRDGDLTLQGWGRGNDFDSDVEGVGGGFLSQSVVLQNNVATHYRNGQRIDSDAHTFATDLQRLVIGGEIAGLGESRLEAAAALVYDRALTDSERQQVESYLQTTYLDDGVNDPPTVADDALTVTVGGAAAVNVLANDSDDTGIDPRSVAIVTAPQNGTITNIDPATGAVTYRSNGTAGPDSFAYTVTDNEGNVSAPATVDVTVGNGGPLSLEGFSDELVLQRSDLSGGNGFFLPISMAFLPDNRMLLLSKDGEIRIVDPESGQSSVYMILNNIDAGQERGLLDITLDPDFESNGKFYLYYTPDNPERARIASFEHNERSGGLTSRGVLASEEVIWEDTDGYLACCHYGGGLDFGPDGKLWLTTSDKFQATTPGEGSSGGVDVMLDLERSSGKVVRVNKDGSIPDGSDGTPANPFIDGPGGNDDSIWAYGLRNPFRARWDEEYGHFYIAEVGGNQQLIAHDDLHLASLDQPRAFYGWPFYEGTPNTYVNDGESAYDPADFPQPDGDLADPAAGDLYSAPIWSFDHAEVASNANTLSASLTGGEVYRGDMFPAEWDGVYFYGDYTQDYIRYLRLDETGTVELGDYAFKPSAEIPGGTNEVVSINVGGDGALYYTLISSGEVRRIVHDGGGSGGGNVAPTIVTAGVTPTEGDLPLLVTFEAEVVDANGDVVDYSLSFGDGSVPVTGEVGGDGLITVEHLYEADGRFDVSLSLSDGALTTLSQVFEVAAGDVNFAPEIDGESSDVAIAEVGSEVNFTATVTDADGDPLNYVWRFGDGNSVAGTVPADGVVTATHTYEAEGGYTAVLEVDDGTETVFSEDVSIQVGTASEVPVTDSLTLLLQSDIKIGLLEPGSDTVSAWLDGSGNGNNLFAEGDPQLLEDQTPSGEPAIVFDGTGDLLQRVDATDTLFNLPGGNADRTVFLVADYVDPEGVYAGVAYGDGAPNEAFGLVAKADDGDLAVQGWGRGNDFDSDVQGVAGEWLVQSAMLEGNILNHYLDGALIASDTHAFATDVQRLVLGGEIAGLGEAALKIGAVLIYNRALSQAERQQVEAFLQDKYLTPAASDPAPMITSADEVSVAENSTFVIDVEATDDVDAEGAGLLYSLSGGWTDGFTIDPASGMLRLNAGLDFENPIDRNRDNTYGVQVTVTDSDGNTDVQDLAVTVTDVDESGGPGTIPVLNGLVAAYEADQNVSLGAGSTVTGWLDGSGLGNDLLAQGDPQLVAGRTPSGQSAIVFDGAGDLLERLNATDTLTAFAGGAADRTVFLVADYVDPEGVYAGLAYGDGAPNEAFGLVAKGNDGDLAVQGWGRGNDFDSDVEGVEADWLVQSAVLEADAFEHYLNGTLIDSGTHRFDTDLQRLVLGGEIAGLGEAQMEIAAALVYNRALGDAERQQVEDFLEDKYLAPDTDMLI